MEAKKTFKEKKKFYKERQVFFDALKLVRQNKSPEITYESQKYKLFSDDSFDYLMKKREVKGVIYSKKQKQNILVDCYYTTKAGFYWITENNKVSKDFKRILCFAKEA